MQVLIQGKKESEVLASVKDEATAEEIHAAMVDREDACVDSKCGCNKC